MTRPLKLCFISLNSYPLFVKDHPGYFGGAELQLSLMAKKLAQDKRFQVSLVVGDYGQKPVVKTRKLTLYLAFKKQRSFPGEIIRFFRLLKTINAHVYIERTLNLKVGLVALFCKLFNKKFIYMIAHDWDTQPNCGGYLTGLARASFRFGLSRADLIVCQTKSQQQTLKNNFGFDSRLIPSLAAPTARLKPSRRRFFLWVGRADRWKQPEVFIKLAKKLPRQKFMIIARRGNDDRFFRTIKRQAQKLVNLQWFEAVSHEKISAYFQLAKALVNTSTAEGFPNTFLQAGLNKTPLVSLTVNPDGFIDRFGCGICANSNFAQLVKACRRVTPAMGRNNHRYVTKYHSLTNSRLFTQILLDHLGRPAA